MHSFSMIRLGSIHVDVSPLRLCKIRISPSCTHSKGCTHSEADRKAFAIILWERQSLVNTYSSLNHICPHFPSCKLVLFTVSALLFILPMLYLYIFWSFLLQDLKWRPCSLSEPQSMELIESRDSPTVRPPGTLKSEEWMEIQLHFYESLLWPWNKYLPKTWKKWVPVYM